MNTISRNQSTLLIISKAVENGFEFNNDDVLENILCDAENFINLNCKVDKYEYCKLYSGTNQSYYYSDGVRDFNASGDIFNFHRANGFVLNDDKTFSEVKWYEIDSLKENGKEVYFFFETIVDSYGNLVQLYC
jgi:hypothetical protein